MKKLAILSCAALLGAGAMNTATAMTVGEEYGLALGGTAAMVGLFVVGLDEGSKALFDTDEMKVNANSVSSPLDGI